MLIQSDHSQTVLVRQCGVVVVGEIGVVVAVVVGVVVGLVVEVVVVVVVGVVVGVGVGVGVVVGVEKTNTIVVGA